MLDCITYECRVYWTITSLLPIYFRHEAFSQLPTKLQLKWSGVHEWNHSRLSGYLRIIAFCTERERERETTQKATQECDWASGDEASRRFWDFHISAPSEEHDFHCTSHNVGNEWTPERFQTAVSCLLGRMDNYKFYAPGESNQPRQECKLLLFFFSCIVFKGNLLIFHLTLVNSCNVIMVILNLFLSIKHDVFSK